MIRYVRDLPSSSSRPWSPDRLRPLQRNRRRKSGLRDGQRSPLSIEPGVGADDLAYLLSAARSLQNILPSAERM